MARTLDNYVRAILSADATAGDATLTLAKAAPPLRDPPNASADAPGVLVLVDVPSAPTKIEIVTYTGVSIVGNKVTVSGVVRGQDGTTAHAWTAGTPTYQGVTAGTLADLQAQVDEKLGADDTAASAVSANKLTTPRAFNVTGVVTADAVSFDGTGNVTLNASIADSALSIAKTNGLQAALNAKADASNVATALQGAKADSAVQPNSAPTFSQITATNANGLVLSTGWQFSRSSDNTVRAGVYNAGTSTWALSFAGNGAATLSQSMTVNGDRIVVRGGLPESKIDLGPDGTQVANVASEINFWHPTIGKFFRVDKNSGSIYGRYGRIPYTFVQASDPGSALASEGDLWVW